ncbi:hypothetical protein [Eubacterium ramulus]|uniref:hypothetical protein n=1 Tax=Eubacterium ramulus TaxID=39490 RepID=UPI0022E5AFA7|nr:hypothetical protein [Eubacterium ramulus]
MKYRLGCYETNGDMECLRTIVGGAEEAKEKARRAYHLLKEVHKCTIWVQKCEYVYPEEEFK